MGRDRVSCMSSKKFQMFYICFGFIMASDIFWDMRRLYFICESEICGIIGA